MQCRMGARGGQGGFALVRDSGAPFSAQQKEGSPGQRLSGQGLHQARERRGAGSQVRSTGQRSCCTGHRGTRLGRDPPEPAVSSVPSNPFCPLTASLISLINYGCWMDRHTAYYFIQGPLSAHVPQPPVLWPLSSFLSIFPTRLWCPGSSDIPEGPVCKRVLPLGAMDDLGRGQVGEQGHSASQELAAKAHVLPFAVGEECEPRW